MTVPYNRFIRQSGLVDSKIFDTPITIIGAGGIGSFTTLALAKMGFSDILVIDYDKVEEHNLPNQYYRVKDIGQYKVDALHDIVYDFTHTEIGTSNSVWTKDSKLETPGIVISAVDNMETREMIYNSIRRSNAIALIDGRMGGNQLEIYTTMLKDGQDKRIYKKTLWKDSETADVPCTERAVMYNVLTIASWICNQCRLVLSNKPYHRQLILDLENMILVVPITK